MGERGSRSNSRLHPRFQLYSPVLVPQALAGELQAAGTPAAVRPWIVQPPACCEIRPDPPADPTLQSLDPSERAAIILAVKLAADRLLIDEVDGRAEAEPGRLQVTGSLGVLAGAQLAGLLDFEEALAHLRSTTFRLHPNFESQVHRRIAAEKKQP